MSYQQTPDPDVNATPQPDMNLKPEPGVSPTPKVNVNPTPKVNVSPTPKVNVSSTSKVNVSPTPKVNVSPTPPIKEEPRKRRGLLLPLLLLLLLLALLFGIFQFFTNSARSGQAVGAAQTATAVARSRGSASSKGTGNSAAAGVGAAGAAGAAGAQGGATLSAPPFNNVGVRDDKDTVQANYDGSGNSYSADALQAAKIVPGQSIVVNDVTYEWPNVAPGKADNYQASGQVIPVTPVKGATVVAFLGASSNGPSTGTGTITYTDGTTQSFNLSFTDWTIRAGKNNISYGNRVAKVMPYRNKGGQKETVSTYLFSNEIALKPGKTIRSVTLPTSTNQGQIHVFAVGTR